MKNTGSVKWYNPKVSYGFIIQDGDGTSVFVHKRALQGLDELFEGDRVTYSVVQSTKGLAAREVRLVEEQAA